MENVCRPSRRRSADHVNNNHIKQVATSSGNANRLMATSNADRLHAPSSPSHHQLLQQQIHQQQLLYHQQQQQQHREKAETQAMFVDSKTNMLEIIEEGLQLKLEIKNIKEQFLSLLHNYDKYQTPVPGEVPMPQLKGVSAARARVKALYEARKQRLLSRRSVGKAEDEFKEPAVPKAKRRRESRENKENKENKENILLPPSMCHKRQSNKVTTSTPFSHKIHKLCKPVTSTKLLTPIKEEANCKRVSPTLSDIEGDYVTLKPPNNYENLSSVTSRKTGYNSGLQMNEDTSIWVNSTDGLSQAKDMTVELSSMNYTGSPTHLTRSAVSPVKYATSNFISELYTSPPSTSSKSLKDVSHITKINSTMREQISGTNLNGSIFHSTMNYPLHSTLNYPLNSTISFPDDMMPHSGASDNAHSSEQNLSDTRTTISEPSHVLLAQSRQKGSTPSPQAFDDSWLDIRSLVKVEKKLSKSKRSSSSSGRSHSSRSARSLSRTPKAQRIARPSLESPRTPTAKPVLCKEHGLHLTYGGPCIFHTDDSFTMSESSEEDPRPRRSSVGGYTETDCDSSYLSECMDEGSNFNMGLSEAEEYTATYDARYGRMKMLKRQTGQIGLDNAQEFRQPMGLSESDFLEATHCLDATKKHLSLEATRSSLPDLSNLETSPSDDDPDSTLKTTQLDNDTSDARDTPVTEIKRPVVTLERTMTNASDQRPPSTLTSTSTSTATSTTSPDSNGAGGLRVPVNSPNVTDSGSSSKPTTDNYDYVEVPVSKNNIKLLPSRHPPRSSSRKRPGSVRSAYTSVSRHRDQQGQARRCLRYNQQHDVDSGFSTPGSLRQRNQQKENQHVVIPDSNGHTRTVMQHSSVSRNLQRDRKKKIVQKLKQFNNTFYSTGNLNIQTLGHF